MIEPRETINNYMDTARGILESVYLDPNKDPGVRRNLQILIEKGQTKRDRGGALLSLVKTYSPEIVNKTIAKAIKYKPEQLPFSPDQFVFRGKVGSGGMNNVFLLESKSPNLPSWVIKIPHRFRKGEIYEQAESTREEYLEISRAFAHIPNLVLGEENLIVHSPRGREPAPAVLQRFMCSEFRDIFNDVSREQLEVLLRDNRPLSHSVGEFIKVFEENPSLFEKQLDIHGDKNLCIVTTVQGPRLLLLDPHYRGTATLEKDKEAIIRERIEYLNSVTESVKRPTITV